MRYTHKQLNWIIASLVIFIILLSFFTVYRLVSIETIDFPEDSYVDDSLKMYFMPQEAAIDTLISLLYSANDSISCVFRALNYQALEDVLIEQEQNGITVRLYVDSDYMGNQRIYLPYTRFSDPDDPMMHANYCIIDGTQVITGSTIFNENTLFFNFHDLLFIDSEPLADRFTSHFWFLYDDHNRSRSFEAENISVGDSIVSALFCPIDDCVTPYVNLIDSAEERVDFAIYAFTHSEIIDAIRRAEARGVTIRGAVDRRGLTPSSIEWENIPGVKISSFNRRLHTKLLVVDSEVSITGSLNPSLRGTTQNDEVVLIIQNPSLGRVYSDYVEYIHSFRKII